MLAGSLKIVGDVKIAGAAVKLILASGGETFWFIVLSFAPSAAAGWHFDGIRLIYGSKSERQNVVV